MYGLYVIKFILMIFINLDISNIDFINLRKSSIKVFLLEDYYIEKSELVGIFCFFLLRKLKL